MVIRNGIDESLESSFAFDWIRSGGTWVRYGGL